MADTGYNHLLRPEYGSPDAQYGLHNFHREACFEQMLSLLRSNAGAVAILEDRPGSGREYFLKASCHRLRQSGRQVALFSLDLDGFEPDQGGLGAYFEHLLKKHKELDDATRDQCAGFLRRQESSHDDIQGLHWARHL